MMHQWKRKNTKENKDEIRIFGKIRRIKPFKFLYPVKVLDSEGNQIDEITDRDTEDLFKIFRPNKSIADKLLPHWKAEQAMLSAYDKETESNYGWQ